MVYLALYKGKKTIKRPIDLFWRGADKLIRIMTRGKYSHCEIAIMANHTAKTSSPMYVCYSSSFRDGGVRKKRMKLPNDKWDLLPLNGLSGDEIKQYFNATQGKHYDVLGVLGYLIGIHQHPNKFFCSEWCYNAIFGSDEGWRFSPVQLAEIASHLSHLDND